MQVLTENAAALLHLSIDWIKIAVKLSRSGLVGERLFMTIGCQKGHAACIMVSISPSN